jgi:predicted PhzF superfamily epimerase YddE/YHI9
MYHDGHWRTPIAAAQGTCVGREGRLYVRCDATTGTMWIGGQTYILVEGSVQLQTGRIA